MSTDTNATVDSAMKISPTTATDAGVDTSGTDDAAVVAAASADMGMPEEFVRTAMNNDPDFADHVKSMAAGSKDTGNEDPAPDDNSGGDDSVAGSDEPKPLADDNSGVTDGGSSDKFADGVIPGLAGADFAKLPESAQLALAEYHNGFQSKVKAAEAAEARVSALLRDPVISSRAAALESGVDVGIRRMNDAEKKFIIDKVREVLGGVEHFDAEDGEAVWAEIGSGLESVAKQMAEDMACAAITAQDSVRKASETIKQGNALLLGLGQFNNAIAVKETDLTKFYKVVDGGKVSFNEGHPEIETFKNGIGKISDWAAKHGIGYDRAIAMGGKAFYAAAAAALDMPVAMNTGARDQKIAADAKQKALAPFLKGAGSKTLATQGTAGAVNREEAERVVVEGVDVKRLVTDAAYHEEVIRRRPGDGGWLERVDTLAAKGRKLIEQRK